MGFKPGRISQATAFAMGGFGAPVRSEIGPYQPLTQCASRLQDPKKPSLWCGYAALGRYFNPYGNFVLVVEVFRRLS
jgi:hypothetical protein